LEPHRVSFEIDSQDAAKFTVKVTFICSVLDPVVVVRDGQVNAADALIAYLRGCQDLFNLGLNYPIKAINRLRTEMAVQVKSYMVLRPPEDPWHGHQLCHGPDRVPECPGRHREAGRGAALLPSAEIPAGLRVL
jgi:hypothetical protein